MTRQQYLADVRRRTEDLKRRNKELEIRNKELNIKLMKAMAQLSDAKDTLRRWQAELEIVASKDGHNLCHIWIPDLLKRTLGHTGNFLDPDGMTEEEFKQGCDDYRSCIYTATRIKQVK